MTHHLYQRRRRRASEEAHTHKTDIDAEEHTPVTFTPGFLSVCLYSFVQIHIFTGIHQRKTHPVNYLDGKWCTAKRKQEEEKKEKRREMDKQGRRKGR